MGHAEDFGSRMARAASGERIVTSHKDLAAYIEESIVNKALVLERLRTRAEGGIPPAEPPHP